MADRQPIPEMIKRQVLAEAGYLCANPRCRNALALEMHHIVWVRDDGSNDAGNLIALCAYCHALHTRGHISRDAIGKWKLLLQSLNEALNRESLDLLIYLFDSEEKHWTLTTSGDGILRLARLINAGMVEEGFSSGGGGVLGSSVHGVYRPKLTDRGRRLVTAWRQGDLDTFRAVLIGES